MKNDFKKLPGSRIELNVTLTDAEFSEYYKKAYDDAAAEVTLKGFRKGAAPKEMVDGAINHDKVFHEGVNAAIRWSLSEIKAEHDWTFIDQPKIEVTSGEPGKGITYKAVLTVFPEVELGNYKKIAKKIFSDKPEVKLTDEEIKKTVDWIRNSRAIETRAVRGAKLGDLIEADIETEADEKPVPQGTIAGDRFILGESNFIKGFDQQLVGKNENEVVHFEITAPEDYWNEALRGKTLSFTVTIRGIFDRTVPEMTDEFAQSLGSQFKTVEDFMKSVNEGLTMEKQEKETEKLRIKALEEIAKDSKMEVPEILVERTLDGMLEQYGQFMTRETDPKKQETMRAEMRKSLREKAESNVRNNLVMYKLAQAETLNPTAEEVEAEAARHNVDPEKEHEYIYSALQNKKIFEFLEKQSEAGA